MLTVEERQQMQQREDQEQAPEPKKENVSHAGLVKEAILSGGYDVESIQVVSYLYRMNNARSRKGDFVAKFDSVPEIDEISSSYGAGKYKLMVQAVTDEENKLIKNFTFSVSQDVKPFTTLNNPVAPVAQNNSMDQVLGITQMIGQLMQNMRPDPEVEMQKMQMYSNMMQQNQMQMAEFFNTMQDNLQKQKMEFYSMIDTYNTPEAEALPIPQEPQLHPLVELILPFIQEYGEKLLNDKTGVMAGLAKGRAEYKEILQVPEAIKQLYESVMQTDGEEKAKALLEKLDLSLV